MKILLKAGEMTDEEFQQWHEKAINFPERKKSRIIKARFSQITPKVEKEPADVTLIAPEDNSMTALQFAEENSALALQIEDADMFHMQDQHNNTMMYSIAVDDKESMKKSQRSRRTGSSRRNSGAEEYKMNEIVPIDASTQGNFSKKKTAFQTA